MDHLYAIREEIDQNKLDEKQATAFHHVVTQLLFAFPRAQKDIQTPVSFLTTRVLIPDEDYWVKLKRVLLYEHRTINQPLILRVENLTAIKLWVDASCTSHPDIRGHTGATMSLGRGSFNEIAKKNRRQN